MIDLHHLRAIQTIARSGSMTAAAAGVALHAVGLRIVIADLEKDERPAF